jgi:hypothetical protein
MISRKFSLTCRRTLRRSRFLQILLIIAFWLIGEGLVLWLGLPVPGGVVGMFILIALFAGGKFSPSNLQFGAECVFRAKLDTQSKANWTPIPRQIGHPVQRKLDSNSASNWTV